MKSYLLLVLLVNSFIIRAQESENTINYQVVFAADNDFLVLYNKTDRYYTFGVHAHLNWRAHKNPFLFKKSDQWFRTISFDVKAFTPDKSKILTHENKRPFAGWTFGTFQHTYLFKQNTLSIGIEAGIVGPSSRASDLQYWYHRSIIKTRTVNGWEEQIDDFIGINLIAKYYKVVLLAKHFQLITDIKSSFGNVNIYVEPNFSILSGLINTPSKSLSCHNSVLGNKNDIEVFFKLTTGIRIVGYDATLQGNIFQNKAMVEPSEINRFNYHVAPSVHAMYHNFFGFFELRYMRGEIKTINNHHYGRICIGYRF